MNKTLRNVVLLAAAAALIPAFAGGGTSDEVAAACPFSGATAEAPRVEAPDTDVASGCPFSGDAEVVEGCPFGGDEIDAGAGCPFGGDARAERQVEPEQAPVEDGAAGCPYLSGEAAASDPIDPVRERNKV